MNKIPSNTSTGLSHDKPPIPDFELLSLIGQGSYGEVWLARAVTGALRAVKVVWRDNFQSDRTFEREFEGIRRYETISRKSPGLVDVLHVGRNETAGFYYYVMELADDSVSGSRIDPEDYAPRTLADDLSTKRSVEAAWFFKHGETLCQALQHLHSNQLTHRDVKPSNIIFVSGVPKLADLGLVADSGQRSFVGTEGYVPPEGPGAPPADIYSLGKVFYEVLTGRDRLEFPELPPERNMKIDPDVWRGLNNITCQACAGNPKKRFTSAKQMAEAVEALRRKPRNSRRLLPPLIAAAALIIAGVWLAWPDSVTPPDPPDIPVAKGPETQSPTLAGTPGISSTNQTSPVAIPAPDDSLLTTPIEKAAPPTPRKGAAWENSIGIPFRPLKNHHISSEPVDLALFNRFIEETKGAFEGEVIPIANGVNGKYRHIVVVPAADAASFCDWLVTQDRESGLIETDHYYYPTPFEEFTVRDPDGEPLQMAFHATLIEQQYGDAKIISRPAGATVFADGTRVGETPYTATRIKAGPIQFSIKLAGYKTITTDSNIPAQETLDLDFDLVPSGALVFKRPWKNSLGMSFVPLGPSLMISAWETRWSDFDAFATASNRDPHHVSDFTQGKNEPVVWVNRQDAIDFCSWLTQHEHVLGLLAHDQEYRLPTDLEWSQAVGLPREKGDDPASRNERIKGIYPWGYEWPPPNETGNYADRAAAPDLRNAILRGYEDGFRFTAAVGSFPANELGVHDLSGNVWEWIAEPFGGPSERFAALGVVRGASWSTRDKAQLLSSCRNAIPPTLRDPLYGFRCVISKIGRAP